MSIPILSHTEQAWKWAKARFLRRSLGYWITAICVLAATSWAMPFIDQRLGLVRERSWLFQQLSKSGDNPARPGNARVVLVGDDEFYDGDMHHRVPTDRAFLARLIHQLDETDPKVIALDFDMVVAHPMRPPTANELGKFGETDPYGAETDLLIQAIEDVALRRKVVLAKTITGPISGPYKFLTDIYQYYGLCSAILPNGEWDNPGIPGHPLSDVVKHHISCGYISLMDDIRRFPVPQTIVGQQGRLDSFAIAVVRANNPTLIPTFDNRPYFGTFIESNLVNNRQITVSARSVMSNPSAVRDILQGEPVFVGAGWHSRYAESGAFVDTHVTPIGQVSGVFIHENLAEAAMSNRIYAGLGPHMLFALEIVAGLVLIFIVASFNLILTRIAALALLAIFFFLAQWFLLRLFGFFFDSAVPLLAVGVHSVLDGVIKEFSHEPATTEQA